MANTNVIDISQLPVEGGMDVVETVLGLDEMGQLTRARYETDAIQSEINNLQVAHTSVEKRLTTTETTVKVMQGDVEDIETRLSVDEKNITALQNADSVLGNRISTVETDINKVETEVNSNKDRISNVESSYKAADSVLGNRISNVESSYKAADANLLKNIQINATDIEVLEQWKTNMEKSEMTFTSGDDSTTVKILDNSIVDYKTVGGQSIIGNGDIEVGKETIVIEVNNNQWTSSYSYSELVEFFKEGYPMILKFIGDVDGLARYAVPYSIGVGDDNWIFFIGANSQWDERPSIYVLNENECYHSNILAYMGEDYSSDFGVSFAENWGIPFNDMYDKQYYGTKSSVNIYAYIDNVQYNIPVNVKWNPEGFFAWALIDADGSPKLYVWDSNTNMDENGYVLPEIREITPEVDFSSYYTKTETDALIANLEIGDGDSISDMVNSAVDGKLDNFIDDSELENYVQKSALATINGQALYEGGDITIEGGSGSLDYATIYNPTLVNTQIQGEMAFQEDYGTYTDTANGIACGYKMNRAMINNLWAKNLHLGNDAEDSTIKIMDSGYEEFNVYAEFTKTGIKEGDTYLSDKYATIESVNTNLSDYYTKVEVDSNLSNYYTKVEVDSIIGDINNILSSI